MEKEHALYYMYVHVHVQIPMFVFPLKGAVWSHSEQDFIGMGSRYVSKRAGFFSIRIHSWYSSGWCLVTFLGMVISSLCDSETGSIQACMASMYPMMLLSGA